MKKIFCFLTKNKMISKILLFIFIGETFALSSLLSQNFCKINERKCVGSYNFLNIYQVNCKNVECIGEYKYACGKDKCAKTQEDCDLYLLLLEMYKFSKFFHSYNKIFNIEEKKAFKIFNNKLQECPLNKNTFKEDDFCLNESNCVEKTRSFRSVRAIYSSKKVECKCTDKLSYHCGKYCTLDSIACDFLKEQNTTLSSTGSINKKCVKNNKIILRYFSF